MAYMNGLLQTEKELQELINLLRYVDLPFQAGRLLEKEIAKQQIKNNSKHWELLANTWSQANEFDRAIKALQVASKHNQKGALFVQLARIHMAESNSQK
jgi:hypothetical protein